MLSQLYTHTVHRITVVLRAIWAGEHILLTLDLGRDPSDGGGGESKDGKAIEEHAGMMRQIKFKGAVLCRKIGQLLQSEELVLQCRPTDCDPEVG